MTIEQIVAVIRALPVPERLRVIAMIARDPANDAPMPDAEVATQSVAVLTERHGLLVVDMEATLPEEVFAPHRSLRLVAPTSPRIVIPKDPPEFAL